MLTLMAIRAFKIWLLATLLVTLLGGCVHVQKEEVVPAPATTVVAPPP